MSDLWTDSGTEDDDIPTSPSASPTSSDAESLDESSEVLEESEASEVLEENEVSRSNQLESREELDVSDADGTEEGAGEGSREATNQWVLQHKYKLLTQRRALHCAPAVRERLVDGPAKVNLEPDHDDVDDFKLAGKPKLAKRSMPAFLSKALGLTQLGREDALEELLGRFARNHVGGSDDFVAIDAVTDAEGHTILHYLAARGDDNVQAFHMVHTHPLFADGFEIDVHGGDGNTPLLDATISGSGEIASYCLEQGADPDVEDTKGYSSNYLAKYLERRKIQTIIMKTRSQSNPLSSPSSEIRLYKREKNTIKREIRAAQVFAAKVKAQEARMERKAERARRLLEEKEASAVAAAAAAAASAATVEDDDVGEGPVVSVLQLHKLDCDGDSDGDGISERHREVVKLVEAREDMEESGCLDYEQFFSLLHHNEWIFDAKCNCRCCKKFQQSYQVRRECPVCKLGWIVSSAKGRKTWHCGKEAVQVRSGGWLVYDYWTNVKTKLDAEFTAAVDRATRRGLGEEAALKARRQKEAQAAAYIADMKKKTTERDTSPCTHCARFPPLPPFDEWIKKEAEADPDAWEWVWTKQTWKRISEVGEIFRRPKTAQRKHRHKIYSKGKAKQLKGIFKKVLLKKQEGQECETLDIFDFAAYVSGDRLSSAFMSSFFLQRDSGFDMNCERGEEGSTPLHVALQNGNYNGAKVLLLHGAKASKKDSTGKSPWGCDKDRRVQAIKKKLSKAWRAEQQDKNASKHRSQIVNLELALDKLQNSKENAMRLKMKETLYIMKYICPVRVRKLKARGRKLRENQSANFPGSLSFKEYCEIVDTQIWKYIPGCSCECCLAEGQRLKDSFKTKEQ